jgi:cell wall-associated NlpC family hydrolase
VYHYGKGGDYMKKNLKLNLVTTFVLGSIIILALPATKTSAAVNGTAPISGQATITNAAIQNGWSQENGKWLYYVNGVKQIGWIHPNNWYYMNSDGVMQTGWVKLDGKWYYMNENGAMQTGWVQVSSKWYYLNGSGIMQTGWVQDNSKWYYLNDDGSMKTGWIQYQDKWCYLDTTSGEMLKGQVVDNGNYVDNNGYWYNTQAQKVIDEACRQLGKPYVYGATGPDSFDCSGLVQYCYNQSLGISLARDTYGQVNEGNEVSSDALQPGDLVFPHASHVQIYIGDGNVIEAPQTGDVVKITPLRGVWHARRIV